MTVTVSSVGTRRADYGTPFQVFCFHPPPGALLLLGSPSSSVNVYLNFIFSPDELTSCYPLARMRYIKYPSISNPILSGVYPSGFDWWGLTIDTSLVEPPCPLFLSTRDVIIVAVLVAGLPKSPIDGVWFCSIVDGSIRSKQRLVYNYEVTFVGLLCLQALYLELNSRKRSILLILPRPDPTCDGSVQQFQLLSLWGRIWNIRVFLCIICVGGLQSWPIWCFGIVWLLVHHSRHENALRRWGKSGGSDGGGYSRCVRRSNSER